jgi:hypothetical protein
MELFDDPILAAALTERVELIAAHPAKLSICVGDIPFLIDKDELHSK